MMSVLDMGHWKVERRGKRQARKGAKSEESGGSVRVRGECGYIYTPFAPLVEA